MPALSQILAGVVGGLERVAHLAGISESNTCEGKASEIYWGSAAAVLALGFVSGEICWICLQSRSLWTVIAYDACILIIASAFSFLCLASSRCLSFVGLGRVKPKLVTYSALILLVSETLPCGEVACWHWNMPLGGWKKQTKLSCLLSLLVLLFSVFGVIMCC